MDLNVRAYNNQKILNICGWVATNFLFLLLFFVILLRLFFPYLANSKHFFEKLATEAFQQPVEIGNLEASWSEFLPVMVFNNITVYDKNHHTKLIQAQHLQLSLNIIDSLIHRKPILNKIYLSGIKLVIKQIADNQWEINGITLPTGTENTNNPIAGILSWLNKQGQIGLNQVDITWIRPDGTRIDLINLRILLTSGLLNRVLIGEGLINSSEHSPFRFVIKFHENIKKHIIANAYIKLKNFNTAPWLGNTTFSGMRLIKGYIDDAEIWADWENNSLHSIQSLITLNDAAIIDTSSLKSILINNFSGNISWTAAAQTPGLMSVSLDADHINIYIANLFSQPLQFDHLKSTVTWLSNQHGENIFIKDFFLTNSELQLKGHMQLEIPPGKNSDPHIQLLTGFSADDVSQTHKYIPEGLLSEKLRAWLTSALTKGERIHGEVLLLGPLHHFPFADHTGRFEALLQTENVDLHYLPAWPPLTHINSNLKFDNNSILVDVINAKMLGINTGAIHVEIPDLKTSVLKIHWNSNANYRDLSRFVFESPLNNILGDILRYFNYVGPTKLNIDLAIPLHNPKEITVNGDYKFIPTGTLQIPEFKIILNKLHGDLEFTKDTIISKGIQAQWLAQPTTFSINSYHKNNAGIETDINIAGGLSFANAIKEYNLDFLTHILSGTTNYKANLKFLKINNLYHTILTANSTLLGVGINLPNPLEKSTNQIVATEVRLDSSQKGTDVSLNYDKKLSAAIVLQKNNLNKLHLFSGNIEFGTGIAKLPIGSGLVIGGKISRLNINELEKYFSPKAAVAGPAIKSTQQIGFMGVNIKRIHLAFDQINALGMSINKALIQAKQTANSLVIQINSREILGNILIPLNLSNSPIRAVFQHIYLNFPAPPKLAKNSTTSSILLNKNIIINPGQIPSLDLIFQNVYYNQRPLGTICILTARHANAMQINRLSIDFPFFSFFATGRWNDVTGKQSTILGGKITTTNMGTLLTNWSISKSLKGANGFANFILGWKGPIYRPDPNKLNGTFSFALDDGEVLNVINNQAEAGIGRILNLLTIQSLQNLLAKPFNLLTPKTGFDFDTLTGDFSVINGNAVTKNTLIKGNLAKIETSGRVGFGARDYDLLIKITPYLTNSFAGASAFLAGPIIGGAVWLANKIIGGVLNSFFSTTYNVTGSWSHPSFKKL